MTLLDTAGQSERPANREIADSVVSEPTVYHGVDIVDIDRIVKAVSRWGNHSSADPLTHGGNQRPRMP